MSEGQWRGTGPRIREDGPTPGILYPQEVLLRVEVEGTEGPLVAVGVGEQADFPYRIDGMSLLWLLLKCMIRDLLPKFVPVPEPFIRLTVAIVSLRDTEEVPEE